jgi:hypothetical protein
LKPQHQAGLGISVCNSIQLLFVNDMTLLQLPESMPVQPRCSGRIVDGLTQSRR